jgi:hypothetical protein
VDQHPDSDPPQTYISLSEILTSSNGSSPKGEGEGTIRILLTLLDSVTKCGVSEAHAPKLIVVPAIPGTMTYL